MPTRSKATDDADPNKLIRTRAGVYRTADDRFEVRQAALGWFVVDSSATDELGQELVRGPFPTLKAIGDELPEARRTTIRPLPRAKQAARGGTSATTRAKPSTKPKPTSKPERSWLDRLPDAEAATARRLIRALTLEGIDDADALVRGSRTAKEPVIATRVLEHRLERLLAELPAGDRDTGRRLLQRAAELLTVTGTSLFDPVPGWAVVEVEAGEEPAGRRLVVRPGSKRKS